MYLSKIIALTGALLCATITVAAAAPTVETRQKRLERASNYVNSCRQAYADFKFGKKPAHVALSEIMMKYPVEQRSYVALVCLGYGEGYEDGRKGLS